MSAQICWRFQQLVSPPVTPLAVAGHVFLCAIYLRLYPPNKQAPPFPSGVDGKTPRILPRSIESMRKSQSGGQGTGIPLRQSVPDDLGGSAIFSLPLLKSVNEDVNVMPSNLNYGNGNVSTGRYPMPCSNSFGIR